jgi:hypothetical protein
MVAEGELGAARRVLVERVPRGARVLLLDDSDDLARALAAEKNATVIRAPAEGLCDVIVASTSDERPLSVLAERMRRLGAPRHTAVVLASGREAASDTDGYEVCETLALDARLLAQLLARGPGRELAKACHDWQHEDQQPLRWLKYHLNRVIASALRIESLAAAFAREAGWRQARRVVLVLRSRQ